MLSLCLAYSGVKNKLIIIIIIIFPCLLKQTENADYDPSRVPKQILFNISNNGTKECFDVPIIDDNEPEDTENFMLTFDTPLNSQPEDPPVNLSPRMFNVAITDNDEGNR